MPIWPAALAHTILARAYALHPEEAVRRTDMELGAARVRRVTTRPPARMPIRCQFSALELRSFEGWFHHELDDGAQWFTMPLANGEGVTLYEARFVGPWRAALADENAWSVEFEVEVKERPTAAAAELDDLLGTNLILWSEQLGSWTPTKCSVSSDAIAAPDGALTADKLVEDNTTGIHKLEQILTKSAAAAAYVIAVRAKAAERSLLRLHGFNGASGVHALFNVAAGTVSATATAFGSGWQAAGQGISSLGAGWYLCWLALVSSAETQMIVQLRPELPGEASYAGDGASGLYLWGAQVQRGVAVPGAYARTTSTPAYP